MGPVWPYPEKLGSAHSSIAPYQAYRTMNGYIVITVGTDRLWEKFCSAISPELIERKEFKTNVGRVSHRDVLEKEIENLLKEKTTDEVYSILVKNGIPCAPVNTIRDAVNNSQIKFREPQILQVMNLDFRLCQEGHS